MTDLLTRLRSAEKGSRELDGRIWCALTPNRKYIAMATSDDEWGQFDPSAVNRKSHCVPGLVFERTDYLGTREDIQKHGGRIQQFPSSPAYTTSVDAILSLIEKRLPGCFYSVTRATGASKRKRKPDNVRIPFDAYVANDDRIGEPGHAFALTEAPTAPLALCIAFLLALEHQS